MSAFKVSEQDLKREGVAAEATAAIVDTAAQALADQEVALTRERDEVLAERDRYKRGFENSENALDRQIHDDAVVELERNTLRKTLETLKSDVDLELENEPSGRDAVIELQRIAKLLGDVVESKQEHS